MLEILVCKHDASDERCAYFEYKYVLIALSSSCCKACKTECQLRALRKHVIDFIEIHTIL